jgi:hypothetical protein
VRNTSTVLRRLRQWLRTRSLDRAPYRTEEGQRVGDIDAKAAAGSQHGDPSGSMGGYPPGYVKSYDEGRPRH